MQDPDITTIIIKLIIIGIILVIDKIIKFRGKKYLKDYHINYSIKRLMVTYINI